MARSSVVLPEPLGPRTAMNSPGSTVEVEPRPELALAPAQGGVFDPQQGVRHSSSASWIAAMLSCIHER